MRARRITDPLVARSRARPAGRAIGRLVVETLNVAPIEKTIPLVGILSGQRASEPAPA
jgi:hypothetical protein